MWPPVGLILISVHGYSKDQTQVAGTNQRLAVLFVHLEKKVNLTIENKLPSIPLSDKQHHGQRGWAERHKVCIRVCVSTNCSHSVSAIRSFSLSAGRSQGENRGPVSRVADKTLIDGRHRVGGQCCFQHRVFQQCFIFTDQFSLSQPVRKP